MKLVLYGVLTGALLGISFPPMPFYLLAFIAFIPLLYALDKPNKNYFMMLYFTFFTYHGLTNWWISSFQKETDPYLMIAGFAIWLTHAFFLMLPIIAYSFVLRKFNRKIALSFLPFIWVAFEWLHSQSELSYPWITIGNTQILNNTWIQFIDITGIWGASFFICYVNVLLFQIVILIKENYSNIVSSKLLKDKLVIKNCVLILLIIVCPLVYGHFRKSEYNFDNLLKTHKTISISVVQPSINPWEKWANGPFEQILIHQKLQDSLTKSQGKSDLSVWSETAIGFLSLDFNSKHNFSFLQNWINENNQPLLSGFCEFYFFKPNENIPITAKSDKLDSSIKYENYNSALMLNPNINGENHKEQVYYKMRLTPFAERLPNAELFVFAQKWFEWGVGISSWGIGTIQKNLYVHKGNQAIPVGNIICIESIYPEFVRNFAYMGAEVLTVITNDAWYDYTPGPEQHFQIAAARAIENKRCIARSANTGVSGFISPTGESISRAKQYKRTAVMQTLPLIKEKTFYTMYGDWLGKFSVIITLCLIIFGFLNSKKIRKSK